MTSTADILFLSHRIPFPPDKGDKIRAHALLRHLVQGRRVHLACHVDDPADMAHAQTLRDLLGGECLFVPLQRSAALARAAASVARGGSLTGGYFWHPRIAAWIKSLVRRHAISQAVVFGSAMAPFILGESQLDAGQSILDMVDVDSDKWAQYARTKMPPLRWLYRYEAMQLARLERKATGRFGNTVLVSPHEADTLRNMAPESAARISSISNGVDLDYFNPDLDFASPFPVGEQAVVMTGLMDYWPNIQGAEWFAAQVLPRLVERWPQARFYAVGAKPPAGFLKAAEGPVCVTGRVKDVRPYLAHAAVVVAPLRIARGVQNKVLEAMAMRRPVVATPAATRALAVTAGREVLIEDDPGRFAQAVAEANRSPMRSALGAQGRRYVERHHNWAQTLPDFDTMLEAARQAKPSPADKPFQNGLAGQLFRGA